MRTWHFEPDERRPWNMAVIVIVRGNEIVLHGPLDQVRRERLLQIANRCPVHRTLTSEIRISTRLAA